MNEYGLSMNVLRKFLETTRTYLDLPHNPARPVSHHLAAYRLPMAGMAARMAIDYREIASV